MIPANLLQGFNLILHLMKLTIFHITEIDHHINLVRTVLKSILCFSNFHLCRIITIWKSNHRAHFYFPVQIVGSSFHIRRWNAYGSRIVFDCLTADSLNLLPCCCLRQKCMIYLLHNLISVHNQPPFLLFTNIFLNKFQIHIFLYFQFIQCAYVLQEK